MYLRVTDATGNTLGYLSQMPESSAPEEMVSRPDTRSETVRAGADFAVPAYVVGAKQLQVWMDGVKCEPGKDAAVASWEEVGEAGAVSAVIRWHDAIPPHIGICVRRD